MEGLIFIREAVNVFIDRIKNVKRLYKVLFGILLLALAACIAVGVSGLRFSYRLQYNGQSTLVADKAVFDQAQQLAAANLADGTADALFAEPSFTLVLTNDDRTSAEELSKLLLDHTPSIVSGYAVVLDGQTKLFVRETEKLEQMMNDRLTSFQIEGEESESKFKQAVTLTPVYYDSAKEADEQMEAFISSLDVVTTLTKTSSYELPFETVTEKTNKQYVGYSNVTTKGVPGEGRKVQMVTYINGQITGESDVTDEIVTEPVNEVITISTAKASFTEIVRQAAQGGYLWPIARNAEVRQYISTYYGESGHKGIDIASKQGTPIYASQGGTVVAATYESGYGNYVLIDHGNGVKTRYAHASKLLVSVGETVAQGQTIALCGTTGRSTGPHLHFEVLVNGSFANPLKFVTSPF